MNIVNVLDNKFAFYHRKNNKPTSFKEGMKMRRNILFVVTTLALLFAGTLMAQDKSSFTYEGSASCKKCHFTKKSGAAYKVWQGSKHASAYEVLASEEAKKIATDKGIEDPQKADACLKCHVTAHGVDAKMLGAKYSVDEGVGCESCHGAGSAYSDKKVKEDIVAGKIKRASVGLIIPTEENCKKCHNEESPTFKGFDFKEYAAKIAHPRPKE